MPVDRTTYHAGQHLEGGHHLQVFLAPDPSSSFLMTNQAIDYGIAVASSRRGLSRLLPTYCFLHCSRLLSLPNSLSPQ